MFGFSEVATSSKKRRNWFAIVFKNFQVAHNCFDFDAVVLIKNLRSVGLELPSNVVFADSMDIMKQVKKKSKGSLLTITLDASVRYFFQEVCNSSRIFLEYLETCKTKFYSIFSPMLIRLLFLLNY